MRALWKIIMLTLLGVCVLLSNSTIASANQCAMRALNETRHALGDHAALNRIYDRYFGEALAQHPVRSQWMKMDASARKQQVDHARRVVVSLAAKLAPYAAATFTWEGNIGTFRLGKRSGRITITMAGGCRMANVCIKDVGCLSSYIGDVKKHANRR